MNDRATPPTEAEAHTDRNDQQPDNDQRHDGDQRSDIGQYPNRYGRATSTRHRWLVWATGGILIATGLGWVIWVGLDQAQRDVRWSDVGFVIEGNTAVRVTYDIGKDPSATAVCRLQALDRSKATVGLTDVTIGPHDRRVTRRTDTVRTSSAAVTGLVANCRTT